jgi:hypothetical protein
MDGGFGKLFNELRPKLDGGRSASENAEQSSHAATVSLSRLPGLSIGFLPADKFPWAANYRFTDAKATAYVGRILRPNKDPSRSHRLRLDRYDMQDFDECVHASEKLTPGSHLSLRDRLSS